MIVVFCVGVELALLTKPNVYSYKRKYVENHLNDISVLLLGNSHIEYALIPEILGDSVFNFAIKAKDWYVDVELAERYIPQMCNLKMVVLSYSYHDFDFGRSNLNRNGNKKELVVRNTSKCMQTKYLGIKQHGYRYYSELLCSGERFMKRFKYSKNTRDFCDSLGFVKIDLSSKTKTWKKQCVPGIIDTIKHRDNIAFADYMHGLKRITELCHAQGAKLILVSAPVYQTYQNAISEMVLKEMRGVADSLNTFYGNVEYYNFLFMKGLEDDDFIDAGHLTETGALKFSVVFRDSVLVRWGKNCHK
jgi:hypothetical protein